MNPAGISYLYMALDQATALAEIKFESSNNVVIGFWTNEKPMMIVDLTCLPEEPSIFDKAKQRDREKLLFLNEFLRSIENPIQKNDINHIEYLPSQVVSEYFSQIFRSENNERIDGLKYRSAMRCEGINLVFFPKNKQYENRFPDFKLIKWLQLKLGDLV